MSGPELRVCCLAAAVLLAGVATPASPSPAAGTLDLRTPIDALALPLIEDGAAVGLVIGVLEDGRTQVLGYGEVERGSGRVPDGTTIYEIGSVTKVFTGVLLAQLAGDGLVDLADPVQRYLPADVPLLPVDDRPITLAHLATHTSGLPRLPLNLLPVDLANPYADYSERMLLDFLAGFRPPQPPGRHEYSNLGMGLLGHLLAGRQDQTYEELVVARIADPLAMKDTRIGLNTEQQRRLAPPYDARLSQVSPWDIPVLAGLGALRSTVHDLLAFAQANLAADGPLAPALRQARELRPDTEDNQPMGLGWMIAGDRRTRWHNGMTGGHASWLSIVPDQAVAVVVLANTATPRVTELGELVTRVACGLEVQPPARRRTVAVQPAVLAAYPGVYTLAPGFLLTVTLEDGQLMVQATGQEKFPVFAESTTRFFYTVVDAQITFINSDDGQVEGLILHQGGRDMQAIRQR